METDHLLYKTKAREYFEKLLGCGPQKETIFKDEERIVLKLIFDHFYAAANSMKFDSRWHLTGRGLKGVIRFCRETVENKSLRQW